MNRKATTAEIELLADQTPAICDLVHKQQKRHSYIRHIFHCPNCNIEVDADVEEVRGSVTLKCLNCKHETSVKVAIAEMFLNDGKPRFLIHRGAKVVILLLPTPDEYDEIFHQTGVRFSV